MKRLNLKSNISLSAITIFTGSILACFAILIYNYQLAIFILISPLVVIISNLILKKPYIALILICISYMFRVQFGYGIITSNIILIALCLLAILAAKRKFNVIPTKKFIFWFFLYFTYLSFSFYFANGRFDYYEINGYLNSFIIMILFCLYDSRHEIEVFYKTVMWCSFGLVLMGIGQLIIDGMPSTGITGFYSNHVVYALHIAWGIPFAFYFYKEYRRNLYLLLLLTLIAGVILAFSRGVLMAVIGAAFVGAFLINWPHLSKRGRLKYLSIGCLVSMVIGIGILNIPTLVNHFNAEDTRRFTSGRSILYQSAWEIFKENPITGAGWERFKDIWSDYADIRRPLYGTFMGDKRLNVHSSYLKILAELGILGFIAFVFLNVSLWRSVWKTSLTKLGAPLLFLMLIYYFHGFVDNNSYGNDRMFYFASGLLFAARFILSNDNENVKRVSTYQDPTSTTS